MFIGPFEHHSNELPWRESIADVVEIHEDADGHIDLAHLEEELVALRDRPLKIGSFSAASNVTGIADRHARASRRCCTATARCRSGISPRPAPYVEIDMAPRRDGRTRPRYKDAIFLSPHKFIGGPGHAGRAGRAPRALRTRVPSVPGGGTVEYVNPLEHRLRARHRAPRGGRHPGDHRVDPRRPRVPAERSGRRRRDPRARGVVHRIARSTSLGGEPEHRDARQPRRCAAVDRLVHRAPRGPYLHHNFVVALLNDLFGIQARGGCSCAGPYGHRLLGIDIDHVARVRGADRARAARASSPAGCASTSRTSSPRRCSRSSWTRWIWWPRRAGSSCRGTGSMPPPGCGATRPDSPSPRCRWTRCPSIPKGSTRLTHRHHEQEAALQRYLAEARALLANLPAAPASEAPEGPMGDAFERLRWFWLPGELAADR